MATKSPPKAPKITKASPISEMQLLQANLLRKASFQGLDGEKVVRSLMINRDLWIAFMIDREAHVAFSERQIRETSKTDLYKDLPPISPIDTIRLRDIAADYWNVDALFILPAPGKEEKLESIARDWGADEIDWYDPLSARFVQINDARVGEYVIGYQVERMLRVWWD